MALHHNATAIRNSSSSGITIKQESRDDHEINQLAIEMAEKNKQKMLSQAAQIAQQTQISQQALQRAGGQQFITFYLKNNSTDKFSQDSLLPKKEEERRKGSIDEESQKGRFGWCTLHNEHIPYLFRHDDKFCAVRMVEAKLINKYLMHLPAEITKCIHVRSHYVTEIEAKLLNEINSKHCEYQFGRDLFSVKDLVVRLRDACSFLKFLETCVKKLVHKTSEPSEHCGFVRINGESVVPYTVKDNIKYVPLFYFEGETDTLKLKAINIEGWELAYLKFCCKVQGIRNELFASDTCTVVSLEDVKQYFPKDARFEDWWPQKTADPMKPHFQNLKGCGGAWTQRPPIQPAPPNSHPAPIVMKTTSSLPVTNKIHNSYSTINSSITTPSLPSPTASVGPYSPSSFNNLNSFYSHWANQAAAMSGYGGANIQALMSSLATDSMRLGHGLSMTSQLIPGLPVAPQSAIHPPPLLRTTTSTSPSILESHIDSTLRSYSSPVLHPSSSPLGTYHHTDASRLINHNSAHNSTAISSKPTSQCKAPPPLVPVCNGLHPDSMSSHKSVSRGSVIDKSKLVDVPTFRPDSTTQDPPYRVGKMKVDGCDIFYINLIAYTYGGENTLVSIQDIIRVFFPGASLQECVNVFNNVLNVRVYKANWHQVYALMKAWGAQNTPDVVPLISGKALITYLSQIKYIFAKHSASAQNAAKRIRT